MTKRSKLITAAIASLFLGGTELAFSFEVLDYLTPDKMGSVHQLNEENAETVDGALEQKAWHLNPDTGRLDFSVRVDPERQNHLTVRFWSEDEVPGAINLVDGEGETVSYGRLDHPTSKNLVPEQWFYSTVRLPRDMTEGRETVRLRLSHDADSVSRGIYEVAVHTGARFQPGPHVPEAKVIKPYSYGSYEPPPEEKVEAMADHLVDVGDRQVEYIMRYQRYASDWREKVAADEWDGPLVGAFHTRGGETLQKRLDNWAGFNMIHNNMGPLKGVITLARAYVMPGGKYEGDPEMLDRIAVAIDFARRAQGVNGAYADVWSQKWVGGPARRRGAGALEGGAHRAQANAFLMVYDDLLEKGMLDEPIDDNADPDSRPVPRRKAYLDLFRGSLSYCMDRRGHAPNQDLMNVSALAPLIEALSILDPELDAEGKELREKTQIRAEEAAGIRPLRGGTYYFSPKGMGMEPDGHRRGGPDGYVHGSPGGIWSIGQAVDNDAVRRRAVAAAEAWPHFWYPVYHDDERIDVRTVGSFNWRNINVSGHGTNPHNFAALDIKLPAHIRAFQLKLTQGEYIDPGKVQPRIPGGGHRYTGARGVMERVESNLRLLRKLPDAEMRMPHEKDEPDFAWVDPMSGTVAIRRGEHRVFMSLNWLNSTENGRPVANDLARVHDMTPEAHRLANIQMDNPHGFGELMIARYGPFLVIANGSNEESYEYVIPEDMRGRVVTEMRSGREGQLKASATIPPSKSAVFVLEE